MGPAENRAFLRLPVHGDRANLAARELLAPDASVGSDPYVNTPHHPSSPHNVSKAFSTSFINSIHLEGTFAAINIYNIYVSDCGQMTIVAAAMCPAGIQA